MSSVQSGTEAREETDADGKEDDGDEYREDTRDMSEDGETD